MHVRHGERPVVRRRARAERPAPARWRRLLRPRRRRLGGSCAAIGTAGAPLEPVRDARRVSIHSRGAYFDEGSLADGGRHGVHLGIRDRRPPRQGRRPDLRRGARRLLAQDPTAASPARRSSRPASRSSPARSPPTRYVDIPQIVRDVIRDIGYTSASTASTPTPAASTWRSTSSRPTSRRASTRRSKRARAGGDALDRIGAGDQGMMFGFACDETPQLMPLPIMLAHALTRRLASAARRDAPRPAPDGKSQVTVALPTRRRARAGRASSASSSPRSTSAASTWTSCARPIIEHVVRAVDPGGAARRRDMRGRDFVLVNPTGRSWSAARWATRASPAARSSSTPTAAWRATAAARSRARTRRRSTARRRTPAAGSRRTSWPRASRAAASCRSPTRSAWRTR